MYRVGRGMSMEKRISVKTLYLIAVITIGLVVLGVGSTYAVFTAKVTIDNPVYLASSLNYTSDLIETVDVTISAGETEYIILDISNDYSTSLNYVIWYIDEGLDLDFGVNKDQTVESLCPNFTTCNGFASGNAASIGIYIRNNSASLVNVTVGVSSSSGNVVLANNMEIIPNQDLPAV